MPKARKTLPNKMKVNVKRKNLVGTRDSGKPAHEMTTTALIAALKNADLKKHHQSIKNVLRARHVDIEALIQDS